MQQKIKYRLIGLAVILVSAAIVFPVFFDGAGYKERHLKSEIPDAPDRPEIVRITPVISLYLIPPLRLNLCSQWSCLKLLKKFRK